MTRLALPDVRFRDSVAATIAEWPVRHIDGAGFWDYEDGRPDTSPEGFPAVVADLLRWGDVTVPPPVGMVHCDFRWITDGEADDPGEVVGFIAIRHSLNEFLLEQGGHIGYSVRPSRRRQGHASRALALARERAAELGIERALVTCDEDNDASRRTIERNGGVYEDTREGKLRYWIVTPAGSGAARP